MVGQATPNHSAWQTYEVHARLKGAKGGEHVTFSLHGQGFDLLIRQFQAGLGDFDNNRVKFLASQKAQNEVEAGVALLKEIYEVVRQDKAGMVHFHLLQRRAG